MMPAEAVFVIVRSTISGVGVGVTVGVDVAVDVDVAVLVAVVVGVAVVVDVDVCVGVEVIVGVALLVAVAAAVAVLAGVAVAVAVGVIVGVGVIVSVAVGGSGVGVLVGVLVFCGVRVAVGEMNVIEPSAVVIVSGEAPVSASRTPDNVSADVPPETVENWTVVRMPSPFAPACAPVVEQPNVTLFAPVAGAGHVTVRPVEPRNVPLVVLIKERTLASQVSVKS